MEHFSEFAWADFVRGISTSEREEMATHLANGCDDCGLARDTWKQVHTITLRDMNYAPPQESVRMAKLEFAAQSFEKSKQPVLANLVFDTFGKTVLAGVRSSAAAAARQMVYEADGLAVDLRFDSPASSKRIFLTGQVLDKRVPRASIEDSAVILWTQKGLAVAETKANSFGEFHLELEAQNNLRISIQVAGRALIRIPLANLRPEKGLDIAPASDVSN
ncbi:MAG TPA: hypothetical protein VJO35_02250 [Terriglobales bacterium]|nr:hypothetical protein [Terriglobales bacterium]